MRFLCILLTGLIPLALLAGPPQEVPLYPGAEVPAEREHIEERGKNGVIDRAISSVHQPALTVYLPKAASGTGVILAPGGGYRHLAIDKEGHDIARWLADHGIAAFVLKYRLPRTEGNAYSVETALEDARQALALVRKHAAGWRSEKVGMMGFSAGGNLAALAGIKLPPSQRPDFLALIYPSVPEGLEIGPDTPPAFLVHADDDKLSSDNSVRFYLGLKKHKIPAELHIYSHGGHGFGMRESNLPVSHWPERFLAWMDAQGYRFPKALSSLQEALPRQK